MTWFWIIVAGLASAVTEVIAACLPNAIPESRRINLSISMADDAQASMPLGIWQNEWTSSILLSKMLKIIAEEVFGINTIISGSGPSSKNALYAICGCQRPDNPRDRGCPSGEASVSKHHVVMEVWDSTNNIAELAKTSPWCSVLELKGSLGFKGSEGMYVLERNRARAFSERGLPLEFYKSYNTSWNKPWEYFPDMSAINNSMLSPCMNDPRIANSYVDFTGDEDGVVTNGTHITPRCWDAAWWIAPACRNDLSSCIPIITSGDGWGLDQMMMQATASGMPVALATAFFRDYKNIPRVQSPLIYWWWPDPTFIDLAPVPLIHQVHNDAAWRRGDKRTQATRENLQKVMHGGLKLASQDLSALLTKWEMDADGMDSLLLDYKHRGQNVTEAEVACHWLQRNGATWRSWIPAKTECAFGLGLVDSEDNYISSRDKAITCRSCKPGTVSLELVDGQGITRYCESCPKGASQQSRGQWRCESCSLGRFAKEVGMTECEECEEGQVAGQHGLTKCEPCIPGRFADHIGFHACFPCSNGTFAPGYGARACLSCPPGADCSSGLRAVAARDYFEIGGSFQECYIKGACLGNTGTGNQTCAVGMKGPLCGMCEVGFTRTRDSTLCQPCPDEVQNYLLVASMVLAYGAYIAITTLVLLRSGKERKSMVSALIKNFTAYFQMTGMALSVCPVGIKEILAGLDMMQLVAENPSRVMALDCLLRSPDAHDADGIFEMTLLFCFLFTLPVTVLGFSSCVVISKRITRWAMLKRSPIIPGLAVIGFLLHPMATNVFISQGFGCIEADGLRLGSNVELQCFGASHMRNLLISLIGLVFFSIGYPAFMLLTMYHNRNYLSHDWMKRYFGFFYAGYDKEHYYWECVIMIRKVIVLLAARAYSDHPHSKPLRMLLLGMFFLLIQVSEDPHADAHNYLLDRLERRGLVAFCLVPASYMLLQFDKELGATGDASIALSVSVVLVNSLSHLAYLSLYLQFWFGLAVRLFLKWYPPHAASGCMGYCLQRLQDAFEYHKLVLQVEGQIDVSSLRHEEKLYVEQTLSYLMKLLADSADFSIDPRSLQLSLQCIAKVHAQRILESDSTPERQSTGVIESIRNAGVDTIRRGMPTAIFDLPNWTSEAQDQSAFLHVLAAQAVEWMSQAGFSDTERPIFVTANEFFDLVDKFVDDLKAKRVIVSAVQLTSETEQRLFSESWASTDTARFSSPGIDSASVIANGMNSDSFVLVVEEESKLGGVANAGSSIHAQAEDVCFPADVTDAVPIDDEVADELRSKELQLASSMKLKECFEAASQTEALFANVMIDTNGSLVCQEVQTAGPTVTNQERAVACQGSQTDMLAQAASGMGETGRTIPSIVSVLHESRQQKPRQRNALEPFESTYEVQRPEDRPHTRT
eukprot:TRINITY_DN7770_c0_g1_i1.p1 TRINITY_DN7770_c0_g1~~TRINITY_DN7770_c0_g1_i1.p1  ORF type:complete len:1392 (-),score=178.15 TRINITY_DN7770_c0_g1_i1:148-4323(-)